MEDGFYNVEVTAKDKAGNITNVSRNIHLEKNKAPAVVDILYPLNGEHKQGIFTINGSEKLSDNVGSTRINLGAKHHNEDDGSRVFWIGYSYAHDRYFDGDIAEVRIWNRTLSKEDVNAPNHFYTVDPASEGLISYWKFDDAAGNIIKDYSPSGYDLTCDKNPKWNKVSLP